MLFSLFFKFCCIIVKVFVFNFFISLFWQAFSDFSNWFQKAIDTWQTFLFLIMDDKLLKKSQKAVVKLKAGMYIRKIVYAFFIIINVWLVLLSFLLQATLWSLYKIKSNNFLKMYNTKLLIKYLNQKYLELLIR